VSDLGTIKHEAAHCAAAVLLGRDVEEVRVDRPGVTGALGIMRTRELPDGEKYGGIDVLISLVGYLVERRPDWPPRYELAVDEEREALCVLIDVLSIDEERWDDLCELAEEFIAAAEFRRVAGLIERALSRCPALSGADVEDLVAIGGAANGS
jgi:hypothetical protein